MLQIGHIQLPTPVILAALSGYSDWPMRALARRMGAPYTIHEVMIESFVNNLKHRERTRRFLRVVDTDHPVAGQLMGSEPAEFADAAVRLVDAGFDVVDINFGCPMKRLRGRCRGGLHLGQPDMALAIVRAVRNTLPDHIPVTVKMRRGLTDSAQSRDHFFEILEGAVQSGVAAVTVHGRTVEQKYVGPSSWQFLREVRAEFPQLTLLGSGDLFTASDCIRMLEETGVNGVTAARGAIGNPWIFQQVQALLQQKPLPPPPSVHQQRELMLEHLQLACEVYDPGQAVRQLRKFSIRYALWHPEAVHVRDAFIRTTQLEDWQMVLQHWYTDDRPGQYPPPPDEACTDEQSDCIPTDVLPGECCDQQNLPEVLQ